MHSEVEDRRVWERRMGAFESCSWPVPVFKALGQRGSNFLVHEAGSPLTKYQFTALFKHCLEVAGVSSKEYGTHSFRIGAATEAARAGLQESEVMRIDRWRSSWYARYIRPELL